MSESMWYILAGLAVVAGLGGLALWLRQRRKKRTPNEIYPMW